MKRFASLVNMGMVTVSLFTFILGILYSFYHYHSIHPLLMIIFFISMVSLNFVVNILDNCEDFVEYQELNETEELKTNVLYRYNMSIADAHRIICYLLVIFAFTGIVLVYYIGWPLLILGIISLLIGILYSQGKHPLSRYPIGELSSGLIMGFVIILASVYINTYETGFTWEKFWQTFIVSLPSTMWISNILLANNICDDEFDTKMGRRTLVYFLGVKRSLHVYVINNVIAFIAILGAVFLKLVPWFVLFVLFAIPFVIKQTKILINKQDKVITFPSSVSIMIVCSLLFILSFFVGLFF